MRRRTDPLPVVGLIAFVVSIGACSEPFRLDAARLAAEGAAVEGAFEEVAFPLPEGLAFRLATPADLEEVLVREFVRQSRAATPVEGVEEEGEGGADVERRAREGARQASIKAPARFDPESGAVLVVADNLRRIAAEAADASLYDVDVVRGMLLHECGRAYAERRFGLNARIEACDTMERVVALGVLSAGIAQLAARRAARARGWEGALARATVLLGGANDEATRVLAFAEETVTRRFEAGGEAAIELALDAPVSALAPPAPRFAFDRLLDLTAAARPEFDARRFEMPRIEIRRRHGFLPGASIDRIVEGIELDRSISFGVDGSDQGAGLAHFRQHRDEAEARFTVDNVRAAFESQPDAKIVARSGAGWEGFFAFAAAGEERGAESALVHVGALTISIFYAGGTDPEALADLFDRLAAIARP